MVLFLMLAAVPAPQMYDARVDEAQQLRRSGRREEAEKLVEVVVRESRTKRDAVSEGRALQKKGDLRLDDGDCPGAKKNYDAAIKALGQSDDIALAQVWNDVGMWAKKCADTNVQKKAFSQALALYTRLDFPKGVRLIANNLGTAHFVSGDVEGALPFFHRAEDAATKLGDDEALMTVKANISLMELLLAQRQTGHECTAFTPAEKKSAHFQRALTAFSEAAAIAQRAGGTSLSVCAKFGSDYSPSCEPCLVKP